MVVNIKCGKMHGSRGRDRDDIVVLDVPEGILRTKNNKEQFYDNIETFAYNTVTRKFGTEVYSCQVFLPLE